jgi:hypothetical protein
MSHPNKGDVIMKEAGKNIRKLTEVVNEQLQKMKIEKDVQCEYGDSALTVIGNIPSICKSQRHWLGYQ